MRELGPGTPITTAMNRAPASVRLNHISSCLTACALISLAGCGASGGGQTASEEGPSSGLNALTSGEELVLRSAPLDPTTPELTDAQKAELSERAATDLQAILNSIEPRQRTPEPGASVASQNSGTPSGPGLSSQTASVPDEGAGLTALASESGVDAGSVEAVAASESVATTTTANSDIAASAAPTDPVAALASKIAALLRTPLDGQTRPRAEDPASAAAALAAIESLAPGSLAQVESESSALSKQLTPNDRTTLLNAAERVRSQPAKAGSAMNQALSQALARMSGTTPLNLPRVALCTKVLGFGRFETFVSDTFYAGKPIRAIVYAEVDGFAYRPARAGDPVQRNVPLAEQQSVDLTQRLSLFHDQSGLLAWHVPAQRVVETSRNQRRDFFLIHQVELPKNLTVGTYVLKITIEDSTSGATTEASLPIKIVAGGSNR